MGKAPLRIMISVVFCAIGENTVSPETFQQPDGQKVVSKPQVRGQSPADAVPTLSCGLPSVATVSLPLTDAFLCLAPALSSMFHLVSFYTRSCEVERRLVPVHVQSCQPVSTGAGPAGLGVALNSHICSLCCPLLTVAPNACCALPHHGSLLIFLSSF